MRKAVLHPEYSGEGYRWTMKDQNGKDSIVSEERDYVFLAQYPGEYYLRLNIIDRENPVEHDIHFIVKEEEVLYSRYISNVYQYCPAPGQFINTLPLYKKGDTAEDMRQKQRKVWLTPRIIAEMKKSEQWYLWEDTEVILLSDLIIQ